VPAIAEVLTAWRERINDLDRDLRFQHIYIFKNVGPAAGASLAHAHSQIVALPIIPPLVEGKLIRAREHFERKQRSLFSDILESEREEGSRLVAENDSFLLFCPYASRFPFELAIFPKRHHPDFASCAAPELQDLGEVLRFALQRLAEILQKPGYNLLLHTAPLRRRATERFASTRDDYCWHLEITPRFNSLAGFEIGLGSYINTVFPEEAARYLRGDAKP
jgi:UDPglucose--hexose-1-phosphate uridylyltransferase